MDIDAVELPARAFADEGKLEQEQSVGELIEAFDGEQASLGDLGRLQEVGLLPASGSPTTVVVKNCLKAALTCSGV